MRTPSPVSFGKRGFSAPQLGRMVYLVTLWLVGVRLGCALWVALAVGIVVGFFSYFRCQVSCHPVLRAQPSNVAW